MTPERCKHYWCYPQSVIQGRTATEVVVVRYCFRCGARQMAFTQKWQKATGDYALEGHYR